MSVQFLQSITPQENQTIRVNDVIARGAITCAEHVSVTGNLSASGLTTLKSITFSPAPVAYTQTGSSGSAVAITGSDESFDVTTFSLTTASGALEAFDVTNSKVGANDSIQLTQVSYSGSYNVNGALMAHIASVSAGTFTVGIRNWGSGSANGPIKLRFKIFHNSA